MIFVISIVFALLIGWVSGVAFIGLPMLKVLRKETCSKPFAFGFGKDVYAIKYMGSIDIIHEDCDANESLS